MSNFLENVVKVQNELKNILNNLDVDIIKSQDKNEKRKLERIRNLYLKNDKEITLELLRMMNFFHVKYKKQKIEPQKNLDFKVRKEEGLRVIDSVIDCF